MRKGLLIGCCLSLIMFILSLMAGLIFGSKSILSTSIAAAGGNYELNIPLGLIPPDIPPDNPLTAAKIELGRLLYFDKRLSADDTVSCATCHDPEHAFAEDEPVSTGIQGKKGTRNSPTTLNAALNLTQFWDGRAPSLEEQAKGPMVNPVEMGMASHQAVVEKLRKIEDYRKRFKDAFGTEDFDIDHVAKAIASFERILLSGNSPFDRLMYGKDESALTDAQKRGLALFIGEARCNTCHGFVGSFGLFTDDDFHNLGVGMDKPELIELARETERGRGVPEGADARMVSELGRFVVTKEVRHIGAFKTPTLRNVEVTAPYMHDGSEATLMDVIEFYNRGGNPNPYLDGGIRPLELTEQEKTDLVEFLKALTSDDLADLTKRVSAG